MSDMMNRWHKIIKWSAVGAVGAILLVVVFAQTGSIGKIHQPIAFNHKKHYQNHVSCDVCHPLYKDHERAGIPGVGICLRCHEEIINRIPEKDKIQNYRESGSEIPWIRVYRIRPSFYGLDTLLRGIPNKVIEHVYGGKDSIYFSHRRHVIFGKIDCSNCHGNVTDMEKPITRPSLKMDMDRCMSCHQTQQEEVSVDCVVCHR
ncbi:MAG TPA: hypothetical protein ENI07_07530 [Desulfobacterales bacterium]|nr:hypothetical protein [Desulfobacterales bacterium]